MLLARQGHRVLLCDRGAFPSDAVSNGFFNALAALYLSRWGLLENLIRAGTPPIHRMRIVVPGSDTSVLLPRPTFAPRRTVLDRVRRQRYGQFEGMEGRDPRADRSGARSALGCSIVG
jgi:hypothetical protein